MRESRKEIRIKGTSVSKGIGIGHVFFLSLVEQEIPEFPITVGEVDREISRYRQALFLSKEELVRIQENLEVEGSKEAGSFIDVHIQMLDDPFITTQMENKIRLMMKNTESVFRSVIKEYENQFSSKADKFFHERFVDVMDVSQRILGHLCETPSRLTSPIPYGSIVFVKELVPSQAASANPAQVLAFVSQEGGGNSHAALIARAKGIPFITSVDIEKLADFHMQNIIVDAITGEIILNPSGATLEEYRQTQAQIATRYQNLERETHRAAITKDGYVISVHGNIGNAHEIKLIPEECQVGLFRTEYLFLQSSQFFPSEKQQIQAYRQVLQEAGARTVVFRLFDVGGDKNQDLFLTQEKEANPILGCRGIRFLLKNPEVLKTQVRAIVQAGQQLDEMKILLPLISNLQEVLQAKLLIEETLQQLKENYGREYPKLSIGSMLEVPSSILTADTIIEHCDFLSLGTNDLVQYTLGIDRSHPSMNDMSCPLHPSILRMIKMISAVAQKSGKPLSICGEIASNPLFIPLLLGLGLKEFSCAPRYIPLIKKMIHQCDVLQCFALAEKALQIPDPEQILQVLVAIYQQNFSEEI